MTDETPTRRSLKNVPAQGARRRKRGRRRRWPWVVGGVFLLMVVVVGGAIWVGSKAITGSSHLRV